MNTIVVNWNTDLNFWELNTAMKTVAVFKHLYDNDKSKGKEDSSKLMWAIALLVDPNPQNVWRNVDPIERKKLITMDYLNNTKFKWDKYDHLIDEYKERCLSIAQKSLVDLEYKLKERSNFISKTPYTLDWYDQDSGKVIKGTAAQLDTMMANTVKVYEQIQLIKNQLDEESIEGHTKGGAAESASEEGLL